jgi:alkanesulfonate monooxygenase SsuD/methylene tetrahydromethanopterin reductase-like flavin-dependent oxidoreductase (luciferase family)
LKIGIGLPTAIPGVDRAGIVDWARRAEAGGFSTLAVLDRVAYPNLEPLACLAAAAAVTESIGLMTDVLLAPLRPNTALLVKQAATIDTLSGGGRLTLGVGVGSRRDDFEASGVDFATRGRALDRQLVRLHQAFGKARLIVGGRSVAAFRRAAEHAGGWTAGGGSPDDFVAGVEQLRRAWTTAGRTDSARTAALAYFALGPGAEEAVRTTVGDYYAFSESFSQPTMANALTDEDGVRRAIEDYAAAGADELILFPASRELSQVDRLAELTR